MVAVVLFALFSVVCLCYSEAFSLGENLPRQNLDLQGTLQCGERSFLKLLSQVTGRVPDCSDRNTNSSRRSPLLSHAREALFSGHYNYQDRRIIYDEDALECHAKEILSSFDLSVQAIACFTFFSLLFIIASFSSYLYRRRRDSSRKCFLTASSFDKRRPRRIFVNLPFHCNRLLFVSFLVAIVFASSTHAIDSAFQDSCEECDPDWICSFSSCLKISTQSLSWSEAAEMCSKQEAHLWSIDNDDVALRDYLDDGYRRTEFFIGLVSSPIARGVYNYRWSDESPFVYSNWERLNERCEDDLCTIIVPNRKTAGSVLNWISVPCSSRNRFICEKPKKLMTSDLQLVDGATPNLGRLEIFLEGAWRRVCLAKNGVNVSATAFAVCRHFGYPDVLFTRALNLFRDENKGNNSFSLACMWNENSIDCSYERVTCDLDLFIHCQSSRKYSLELRLENGSVPSEGIVQLGINGDWGYLDVSRSDQIFYNLLCKRLGYSGSHTDLQFVRALHSGSEFGSYLPACSSFDSLTDCQFLRVLNLPRNFYEIRCFNADWHVRLVNTADTAIEKEGSVEVFYKGMWTIICGVDRNKWDLSEASVVCRQLGFAKAVSAYLERLESTPKSLNQNRSFLAVACNGSETSLRDCEHMLPPQNHSCRKAVTICKKNEYCPFGWLLYGEYCYSISVPDMSINHLTYWFPIKGCGPINSGSISSPHEQAFVLSLLPGYQLERDVLIGLTRDDSGAFQWINKEPLRYVLWAAEEPKTNFNCAVMDIRSGYWKTVDCSTHRKLLCKISLRDIDNEIRLQSDPLQDDRCRPDEVYFESACYYISKDKDESVSKEVAHNEKCKRRGAALVSIGNVFENGFVAKETSSVQGSLYWTGLFYNESFAREAFTWLDASPISFTKWGKYEPAYPKGENQGCVLLGSDGHEFVWSVSNCSAKAQYACKRFLNNSHILAPPQTLPLGYVYSCPNGWTKLGTRSCFKHVFEKKTWQDSLTDCEAMETRSSLARILSIHEQNELSLLLFKAEDEAWIGLNDISNEGFYVWSDGSPLVYVNWTLFEDDTNSSVNNVQDCVAATKSFWKLDSCSKEKASVCFTHATLNFDECSNSSDSCHINATCENTISSYICTCKPGFSGNGTMCKDYDECSNNADNCHVNATCENTISSYMCMCKSGFTGNGTNCEDIDECEYSCKKENQKCSNTLGSHECVCVGGWTMNNSQCIDINECNSRDVCHSHADCINEPGFYWCKCKPGWKGSGSICVDVNECELINNNSCHSEAICRNYEGGYNCMCQKGWSGNGTFCLDINECEMNNSCHSKANCTNQNGYYDCTCLPGWSGNGTSCIDTDECQQSNICHDWADCTNTIGSHECRCHRGYAGNGTYCEAQSNSQWKIALSVTLSFTFLAFVFIVAGVYARRKTSRKNGLGSDFAMPSNEWEVNSGDMTLLEKLGDGFFGVVYKAYLYHSPSQRMSMLAQKERSSFGNEKSVVACKMLKESNLEEQELLEEIKLMKRIGQHPHIVSLLGCITTSKPFCLIVEYCMNGDLLNYLRKGKIKCADDREQHSDESVLKCENLSEDETPAPSPLSANNHHWREMNEEELSEVKNVVDDKKGEERKGEQDFSAGDNMSFVWQIASGMEYLAGKGLVHRDLACRNVLVCDNKLLKVSDFGLTRSVYHDGAYCQKTTRRLPLRWMSIEAITQRLFSEQSDVWSFGIVMWEICTLGSFPYPCISSGKLLSHLRSGNRLTCPDNCPAELYKIMSACWRADPDARPAFSRLTQLLGKMLAAENQSQYIDFDATGSLLSYDTESRGVKEEWEGGDEDWCLNSVTQVTISGDDDEVRYVVGSATSAVAEKIV